MRITLRHLEIFSEVAKQLSISKAAHALGVTQPAVSQQIAQLERLLGVKVIEIIGRKVFLTDVGQSILKQANFIGREVENLALLVDDQDEELNGKLRMTVADSVQSVAIRLLGNFYKENPRIHLEVNTVDGADRLATLHNNMTDICFVTNLPVSSRFESVKLLDVPIVIAVSKNHRLAKSGQASVKELAKENVITGKKYVLTQRNLHPIIAEQSEATRMLEFNNSELQKIALMNNLGFAALPKMIIEEELKSGELVELKVKNFPVYHGLYMVTLKGRQLSRTAAAFKAYVEKEML